VSTVTLTLLWISLSALWRGHRTDPGFVTIKKSDDGTLCKRCDVNKPSASTHHCSNCKKCVMDMDHHCFLMDNCVGKHSVRFFVQYSTWISVLLVWAIAVYIKGFYSQNTFTGNGVKNLFELRPDYVFVYLFSFGSPLPRELIFIQVYGTKREDLDMFIIDNCLIIFSLGFLIFASSVLYQTLHNIRNYSSEPDRLKGIKLNKVRSIEEMKNHIFGKQATLCQILLPFN